MLVKIIPSLTLIFISFVAVKAQRVIDGVKIPIVNSAVSYFPKLDYPQEAENMCVSGKVELLVEFMASGGKPLSVKAIFGDELLIEAAEKAAKEIIFSPRNELRENFKIKGIIIYNFVPKKKCLDASVVNKRAIYLPKPTYPRDTISNGIVEVRIIIDESGKVILARAISGNPLLFVSAEIAARKAKFNPTNISIRINIKALLVYKFNSDGSVETDFPKGNTTKKQ